MNHYVAKPLHRELSLAEAETGEAIGTRTREPDRDFDRNGFRERWLFDSSLIAKVCGAFLEETPICEISESVAERNRENLASSMETLASKMDWPGAGRILPEIQKACDALEHHLMAEVAGSTLGNRIERVAKIRMRRAVPGAAGIRLSVVEDHRESPWPSSRTDLFE